MIDDKAFEMMDNLVACSKFDATIVAVEADDNPYAAFSGDARALGALIVMLTFVIADKTENKMFPAFIAEAITKNMEVEENDN